VRISIFDVEAAAAFGIAGYVFHVLDCHLAPLQPISGAILAVGALIVLAQLYAAWRGRSQAAALVVQAESRE
jgi:TctA family transporter